MDPSDPPKPTQMLPPGYVTIAEAARRLGITHAAADKRIARGYLKVTVLPVPTRLVAIADIEDSHQHTPLPGRKGECHGSPND